MGVGEWIAIAGIPAAVVTAITGFYCARAYEWLDDAAHRQKKLDELQEGGVAHLYEAWLSGGLAWLDKYFGARLFGGRGLTLCLFIALLYPLAFFLVGWGIGGLGTIGTTELLPPIANGWVRAGLVLAALAFYAGLGAVAWHSQAIDRAAERWLARKLTGNREHAARPVYRILCGVLAGAIVAGGAFLATGDPLWAVAIAVALAFAVAFAGAGVAFALAFAVAVAFAVAFAFALAATGAGAIAFILAFAFAIAGAGAFAAAVALVLTMAIVVAVAFGGVTAEGTAILLFFMLLPLANGVLDYLSLGISRALGRGILAPGRTVGKILRHGSYDLFAAGFLLAALAFLLPFMVQTFNLVVELSGESGPLQLGGFLDRARSGASPGDRFWLATMLFSTLLPTFIHLVALLAGVLTLAPFRQWKARTIAKLEQPALTGEERLWVAVYLTFPWLEGALGAVLALTCLGGVIYGILELTAQFSIAEGLYWIAMRGIGAANWAFPAASP